MRVIKGTGVYMIRNTINDKVYIGSTFQGFHARWGGHKRALVRGKHQNRHLQSAWNKYGGHSFDFSVLEFVNTRADVIRREQYWIDLFLSTQECYNISPTAGSNAGFRYTMSDETKRRVGDANRGKRRTAEQKARMSQMMKGRPPNPAFIAAARRATIKTYHCQIVSPEGVIYERITNLDTFCREHGLRSTTMNWVMSGKKLSHRGWRRLDTKLYGAAAQGAAASHRMQRPGHRENMREIAKKAMQNEAYKERCTKALRDPDVRERARLSTIRRTYDFAAPDGTQYHVTDLSTFCKAHGLDPVVMRQISNPRSRMKSWKGWSLPGWARRACAFIAPDGTQHDNITNLAAFCAEHGLSAAHMSSVFSGKRARHRGWKRAP